MGFDALSVKRRINQKYTEIKKNKRVLIESIVYIRYVDILMRVM
ncbi:hypothetical protein [Bacillus subtilis]|nr:hypothetical protein [Bacillus subtilis]